MGRPLFGSNLHSASCHCQSCVFPPLSDPGSSTATLQQPPSLSEPPFADRVRDLHNHALQAEATVLQSIADSQQSLRRASSAIEAAYERLLALRLRLRHSLDTMSTRPHIPGSTSTMGPEHSAIVLSSDPAAPEPTTMARDSNALADPVLPSEERPHSSRSEGQPSTLRTIRRRFAELAGGVEELDSSMPRIRPYVPRTASPRRYVPSPSGPRSPAEPSTSSAASYRVSPPVVRHNISSTDASTSLGRRVEARASAARAATAENLRSDLHEFMEAADASLALLAQQGQQLLVSSRDFRQDPSGTSEESGGTGNFASSPSSTTDATTRRWFARDRAALWRQNMRDRRPRDPEGNTNGIVISLRSLHGDRAPDTTASTSAPIIVRARTESISMPELEEDEMDDPTNRRSYRIRRRLNPDGGIDIQHGRPSGFEEDEEDATLWLRPRRRTQQWAGLSPARVWPTTSGQEPDATTTAEDIASGATSQLRSYFLWSPSDIARRRLSTAIPPGRRRRGWARLDPDGNEIPTDEEEEYERNRTHMRVRAQALTARQPNRHQAVERMSVEATSLPPPPPSDDWIFPDPAALSSLPALERAGTERHRSPVFRVRLNSQDSVSSSASTVTANFDLSEQDTAITSSPPFQPSPLPWSSFDLSPATRNPHMQQKETNSLRVRSSIWSPFAGR